VPSQIAAALIAASAALLGAVLAGVIAIVTLKINQNAETRRRKLEAQERSQTRFHEARLRVYAEFLESAGKTGRLVLKLALERRLKHVDRISGIPSKVDEQGLEDHTPQETSRLLREVLLLSRSAEVREAADRLWTDLWLTAGVPSDASAEDFSRVITMASAQISAAFDTFVVAARAELDS
jgi:hypothetical protein